MTSLNPGIFFPSNFSSVLFFLKFIKNIQKCLTSNIVFSFSLKQCMHTSNDICTSRFFPSNFNSVHFHCKFIKNFQKAVKINQYKPVHLVYTGSVTCVKLDFDIELLSLIDVSHNQHVKCFIKTNHVSASTYMAARKTKYRLV